MIGAFIGVAIPMKNALVSVQSVGTVGLGPFVAAPGLIYLGAALFAVIYAVRREREHEFACFATAVGIPGFVVALSSLTQV